MLNKIPKKNNTEKFFKPEIKLTLSRQYMIPDFYHKNKLEDTQKFLVPLF